MAVSNDCSTAMGRTAWGVCVSRVTYVGIRCDAAEECPAVRAKDLRVAVLVTHNIKDAHIAPRRGIVQVDVRLKERSGLCGVFRSERIDSCVRAMVGRLGRGAPRPRRGAILALHHGGDEKVCAQKMFLERRMPCRCYVRRFGASRVRKGQEALCRS